MKRRIPTTHLLLISIFTLLLFGCTNKTVESDAYGNFEADKTIISAEANGIIKVLNIEEGESVKANTTIGYIDSTTIALKKASLQQLRQNTLHQIPNSITPEIAVMEQQRSTIKTELNRVEKLLLNNAATQKQYDAVKGSYDLIIKKIEALEAKKQGVYDKVKTIDIQLMEVEDLIEKSIITNPVSGTVITKFKEQNEFTTVGMPLYEIADLSEITLKAYVDGAQLPSIKIGDRVEVIFDANREQNQQLEGTLYWIASEAEFTPKIIQTKNERVSLVYAIKVRVANDGRVKIGMPGEVNFKK